MAKRGSSKLCVGQQFITKQCWLEIDSCRALWQKKTDFHQLTEAPVTLAGPEFRWLETVQPSNREQEVLPVCQQTNLPRDDWHWLDAFGQEM